MTKDPLGEIVQHRKKSYVHQIYIRPTLSPPAFLVNALGSDQHHSLSCTCVINHHLKGVDLIHQCETASNLIYFSLVCV